MANNDHSQDNAPKGFFRNMWNFIQKGAKVGLFTGVFASAAGFLSKTAAGVFGNMFFYGGAGLTHIGLTAKLGSWLAGIGQGFVCSCLGKLGATQMAWLAGETILAGVCVGTGIALVSAPAYAVGKWIYNKIANQQPAKETPVKPSKADLEEQLRQEITERYANDAAEHKKLVSSVTKNFNAAKELGESLEKCAEKLINHGFPEKIVQKVHKALTPSRPTVTSP